MDLSILAVSKLCQDISFTNIGQVGQCLVESTMFGDVAFAGVIIFVLFAGLIVKYGLPVTIMIPVGLALTYVLWLMTASDIFMGVLILALIVGGAVLIIALLNYLNR